MLKKLTAVLLMALLCLSAAVMTACGDDPAPASENAASGGPSEDAETSKEEVFLNEVRSFGGETVRIFTHDADHSRFSTCIVAQEQNNEPINDAFWERNNYIEQNYGIKLELEKCDNPWDGVNRLRSDIESGAKEIQIAALPLVYLAPLGVDGLLLDFNSVNNGNLHLDQVWWDQSLRRDLTLKGKNWFLAGDALVEDDEATWAVYFNKDLIEKYGLEVPYDLVKKNEWTLDKMYEMAKAVHHMDGDKMDFAVNSGDIFGVVVQSYDCYALMLGAGQKMIENDGDQLTFRVNSQENVTAFHKVMEMVLDDVNVGVADFYGRWDGTVYQDEYRIFASGGALFMPYTIATVSTEEMRDAQIHYGILPMPKADEFQDGYTTSVTVYWCEVLAVPYNISEKLDVTTYALEAMAFHGKRLVTPEYYTRTLTYKRFDDNESGEMLDLIFRNRIYDLAGIFNFGDRSNVGTLGFYTELLCAKSNDLVSLWGSRENLYEAAVEEFMDQLK